MESNIVRKIGQVLDEVWEIFGHVRRQVYMLSNCTMLMGDGSFEMDDKH
jgi:hypothetical protein